MIRFIERALTPVRAFLLNGCILSDGTVGGWDLSQGSRSSFPVEWEAGMNPARSLQLPVESSVWMSARSIGDG